MCTMSAFTQDGHDFHLHAYGDGTYDVVCAQTMELIGRVEMSPCGEYYIAEELSNPLGMAVHFHVNATSLEDVAHSLIAGSY